MQLILINSVKNEGFGGLFEKYNEEDIDLLHWEYRMLSLATTDDVNTRNISRPITAIVVTKLIPEGRIPATLRHGPSTGDVQGTRSNKDDKLKNVRLGDDKVTRTELIESAASDTEMTNYSADTDSLLTRH